MLNLNIIDVNKTNRRNLTCWLATASNMLATYFGRDNDYATQIYNELIEEFSENKTGRIQDALSWYSDKYNLNLNQNVHYGLFFIPFNARYLLFQMTTDRIIGISIGWENVNTGHTLFLNSMSTSKLLISDSDDEKFGTFWYPYEIRNNSIYILNYSNPDPYIKYIVSIGNGK